MPTSRHIPSSISGEAMSKCKRKQRKAQPEQSSMQEKGKHCHAIAIDEAKRAAEPQSRSGMITHAAAHKR